MSLLFSLCFLQVSLFTIVSLVNAHPTYRTNQIDTNEVFVGPANKRSFDRLETSPFDFGGAYAKRYSEDDSFDFNRRKKSFDRLEVSPFSFGQKRKRSFDRISDSPFSFGQKRSFDRVSNSPFSFGMNKRSVSGEPQRQTIVSTDSLQNKSLSIAELMQQVKQRQKQLSDPTLLYYSQ